MSDFEFDPPYEDDEFDSIMDSQTSFITDVELESVWGEHKLPERFSHLKLQSCLGVLAVEARICQFTSLTEVIEQNESGPTVIVQDDIRTVILSEDLFFASSRMEVFAGFYDRLLRTLREEDSSEVSIKTFNAFVSHVEAENKKDIGDMWGTVPIHKWLVTYNALLATFYTIDGSSNFTSFLADEDPGN